LFKQNKAFIAKKKFNETIRLMIVNVLFLKRQKSSFVTRTNDIFIFRWKNSAL